MKILINNTGNPVAIVDTGITVPASSQYTIPPQDYLVWAASSDVIVEIGNSVLTVNDGSVDLSIADGTRLIQGIFPNPVGIAAGDDGTPIGHVLDAAKVHIASIAGISGEGVSHINRVDVASAARTISGNSGTLDSQGFGCLSFIVNVTAVSGSSPKMDVFFEVSDDNLNWSSPVQTRRLTGTGDQRFQRQTLGAKYYRFSWTIAGSTPSFTFSIVSTLKAYLPRRFANKIQYEFDLTQAVGTASEVFNAVDAPNVSLITTRAADAGSGAQYKIQVSNDSVNWVMITNAITQNSDSENANTLSGAYRFYRLILTANSNPGVRVMDIFWACNS